MSGRISLGGDGARDNWSGVVDLARRPALFAAVGVSFLTVLLAVDHFASFHEQLGLGALTWAVFLVALRLFPL